MNEPNPEPPKTQPPKIRPHEEQSALERTLRAHLWHPQDLLKRASAALPGHIRRKEYRQAADWQDCIRKAEGEIEKWENLLSLYEAERTEERTNPL